MTRYVPILRWKEGERTALKNLSGLARHGLLPLVRLGTDNFKDKKATKKLPSVTAHMQFIREAEDAFSGMPFLLDASSLAETVGAAHPLLAIFEASNGTSVAFNPVITLSDIGGRYGETALRILNASGTGICLRIQLGELDMLKAGLPSFPFDLSMVDLIVDAGDTIATVENLGSGIVGAFLGLPGGAAWRSVTVGGARMPSMFTGLPEGIHLLRRSEIFLWRMLSKSDLPYKIDFCDYATVSQVGPSGMARPGYAVTAKYTLAEQFMICRGKKTKGPGASTFATEYSDHAAAIRNYPERRELSHCWADQIINQIAEGARSPGGATQWVGYAVNRHIEITRELLPQ